MVVIAESLEKLKLEHEDSISSEDVFLDITQCLVNLTSVLTPETVVKESTFSLFEGTYALEVCNVKLDSSLIELTEEEVNFDCGVPHGKDEEEQLLYVSSICDRLCRSMMNWLHDYQTLPTTVLSCRYVEELMGKYTKYPLDSLKLLDLNTGSVLYDQVLYSCVLGICSLIKFAHTLLQAGVVYEEEDLNCNVMNLDMLSNIENTQVIQELEKSLQFLEQHYPNSQHLKNIVLVFKHLLYLPMFCPKTEINISDDISLLQVIPGFLAELDQSTFIPKYPPGCFSKGIQKRRDNNFPPKELFEPKGDEYRSFSSFIDDILTVLSIKDCTSVFEIRQFVWFFNRNKQRNVLARALLPLYLIRDHGYVLDKYPFRIFAEMHLYEFSLTGTELGSKLKNDELIYTELESYFSEISNCLFEWYQNMSQNSCRHRQGFNRQLLVWDSLQASLEQFEVQLEAIGVKDLINSIPGATLMPISTWIYTNKLLSMIEFVLEGFRLNVYKPWESFAQYWFCYYLSSHLESNLKRLHQYLEQRMAYISALGKKLKKLKAGEKKEKAKERYRNLMATEMPSLRENNRTTNYFFMICTILKSLSLAQVFQFSFLRTHGLINSRNPIPNHFCSDKLIHELRFKTFSSIGIPEIPTYDQFEKSLQDFAIEPPSLESKMAKSLEFMNCELENVKIALNTIISTIEIGEREESPINTGTKFAKEGALKWYKSLLNTTKALSLNASIIEKKLGSTISTKISEKYKIELKFTPDGCPYFPLLTLVPVRTKH